MKPSIFSTSFKVLITVLLLLSVLFNRRLSQNLMLAAIVIWCAVSFWIFFGKRLWSFIRSQRRLRRSPTIMEGLPEFPSSAEPFENPDPVSEIIFTPSQEPDAGEERQRMLQHISMRITEKLKSAYSDATWRWEIPPSLTDILDGKTVRIAVDDMERYTHADIHFDRYARIRITPLIVGDFGQVPAGHGTAAGTESKEPAVVDVASWYELIGRPALEPVITELNVNGHSRLAIKENGDIVITRNKKEALKGTLTQFPPKNYWNELLRLLEDYELHGKIEKDRMIISWI